MFEPKPLGEAIAFHTGGGTPSRQVPSYWGGGIPWASVKDFTDDAEYISATQETISQKGLNASASNLIPPGTPLVCTRMAVGRAAMPTVPMAINQDVKALYPAPSVTPAYLLSVLQYTQRFAEAQSIGSTVKGIRIQDYLAIPVPQAPEVEQPKIAEILGTLNTAIHQTEAIVEKLKQVKQGLLHDLLTRGVDVNGELRPSYEEAPELYKESPLGWIPKEWDVMCLGSIATSSVIGPFGSNLVATDYRTSGVPVVFVRDVRDTGFEWNSFVYITQSKAAALAVHDVIPGDVLATKMGLPPCVSAVYPDWMPQGIITADILRFRVDKNKYRPSWVSHCINETAVVKQVETITAGVTRPKVTLRDARELQLRIPPVLEQDRILERLDAMGEKIRLESDQLAKLKAEKMGLMDDLLTGRVRVTPLLAQ